MLTQEMREKIFDIFGVLVVNPSDTSMSTTKDLMRDGILITNREGVLARHVTSQNKRVLKKCLVTQEKIDGGTFFPSWDFISDTPNYELAVIQLVHYFSTYGLESLGLSAAPLRIPSSALSLPIPQREFKVIRILTVDEFGQKFKEFCMSVVAPNRDHMDLFGSLFNLYEIDVESMPSRELRVMVHAVNGTVPKNGEDFLRVLIYRVTGETLIIKNGKLISAIKRTLELYSVTTREIVINSFVNCDRIELAGIFNRYKPLILAFKAEPAVRPIINRISKLSKLHHVPMEELTVQNVSELISRGEYHYVMRVLEKASMRQLIKLLNYFFGLPICDGGDHYGVYQIRNGKVHVEKIEPKQEVVETGRRLVGDALASKIRENRKLYANKTVYLPHYVSYAAPYSEKQMLGNIPNGTTFTSNVKDEITYGIYWDNLNGRRVDLDFHARNIDGSIGWNTQFSNRIDRAVSYSGDMTDATNGAVELMRFNSASDKSYIMSVNSYNCGDITVPFKFFATSKGFSETVTVGSNSEERMALIGESAFPPVRIEISDKTQMLGIAKGNVFTVCNSLLERGACPSNITYTKVVEDFERKLDKTLKIEAILKLSGAIFVDDPEKADINLSPEELTPTTLTGIIDSFN